jgi:hypothetical protein
MTTIIKAIKLILITCLSIFYYPLNTAFMFFQKHYRGWQKTDMVSFVIATPLYYFLFIITAVLSFPLEVMGDKFHPPLGGFR